MTTIGGVTQEYVGDEIALMQQEMQQRLNRIKEMSFGDYIMDIPSQTVKSAQPGGIYLLIPIGEF